MILEGPSFSLPPRVKPPRIGGYLLQHCTGVTLTIALGCKVDYQYQTSPSSNYAMLRPEHESERSGFRSELHQTRYFERVILWLTSAFLMPQNTPYLHQEVTLRSTWIPSFLYLLTSTSSRALEIPSLSPSFFHSFQKSLREHEVTQSCPTLCDPVDCSPPDSSIHRIFQARILEWVAISFSRGSS